MKISPRFVVFAVTPTIVLLAAAEGAVRLKYFLSPLGHDWRYLTTPIGRGSAASATQADASTVEGAHDDQDDQMVFRWQTPCASHTVFSIELRRELPRTWDEHCFRGDRVSEGKDATQFRVFVLGGSTVEDAQSDDEMMTSQLKHFLPATYRQRRIAVVNAGHANFDSRVIRAYWRSIVHGFSPDLVVYYEAWNEQQGDIKFTGMRIDERLASFARHGIHRALYYRSMLYTYLVERFGMRMAAGPRFWKVDLDQLRNFVELAKSVRQAGAEFVFVTQVVRFPRMWRGVDTFDYQAVEGLIDRLHADKQYAYNVMEISALNQRLVVDYTIDLCRRESIPVINILDAVEALGDKARGDLFTDLGHLTVKGDQMVGELIAAGLQLQ